VEGTIQLEYRGGTANDEFIGGGHSSCRLDESKFMHPAVDEASPSLARLPPSPCRSLGGYFSYEGWPDQQRFIELDEALRREAYNGGRKDRRHREC
jgi:hypothetical protein